MKVSYSSVSNINAIIVIDCLFPGDLKTGQSRHEDVRNKIIMSIPEISDDEINKILKINCGTLNDFLTCMAQIERSCKNGSQPLLFIDGHGNSEQGLAFSSGEFIEWNHYLDCLKKITDAANGELTVVAAFCYSFSAVKLLNNFEKLPFAFYYGYEGKVTAGLVETESSEINRKIFGDRGKGLRKNPGSMMGYSEYDHAEQYYIPAINLIKNPKELATAVPLLSKAKLRAQLDELLARDGNKLSGSRKIFNEITRGNLLAVYLIEKYMHDTPRRKRLIDEVIRHLESDTAKANSSIEKEESAQENPYP